jgi:AcrR family transcriptional regulator
MARPRSPEKSRAILQAAVQEIALAGLGASTAKIARAAKLAEGTLFTYFPTKDDLLNALYFELKSEVYRRIQDGFPDQAELRLRARHIWVAYLRWAIEQPEERKVSLQLNVSDVVTDATRKRVAALSGPVVPTLREVAGMGVFLGMPKEFVSSAMGAMQEAVMETVAKNPAKKEKLIERGFEAFWRMTV